MTTPLPLLLTLPEPLCEVLRSMLKEEPPALALALRPETEPILVPLSKTPPPVEEERRMGWPEPGVEAPEAGAPSSMAATRSASVAGVLGVAGPGEVEIADVFKVGFILGVTGVRGCMVSVVLLNGLVGSARLGDDGIDYRIGDKYASGEIDCADFHSHAPPDQTARTRSRRSLHEQVVGEVYERDPLVAFFRRFRRDGTRDTAVRCSSSPRGTTPHSSSKSADSR